MGYFQAIRRRPAAEFGELEGPLLQMPPFATITGYRDNVSALSGAQLARIKSVAEFIAQSWRGTAAITSIRITGYVNAREGDAALGKQRADAVVSALLSVFNSMGETLASRVFWIVEDRGLADAAKVEIYLWAGPTAPPVPPLVRIPSPAEAAKRGAKPETLDERINRILRTAPPPPPRGRSFNDLFWKRVNERLDAAMERLRVPRSIRGAVRKGVEGAIRSGSEAVLDDVLKAADLPEATRNAIKGTAKALMQQQVR